MSREHSGGHPTETLFQGKHLTLKRRGAWEFVQRSGASGVVAVVALTAERELVLVEQHRPPVGCSVIELPAGLVGDLLDQPDEAALTAAKRELVEETGFEGDAWREIWAGPVSAGLTDEQVTLFYATGLRRTGEGGGDESEQISVHLVPVSQLRGWLTACQTRGLLVDHKVLSAVLLVERAD